MHRLFLWKTKKVLQLLPVLSIKTLDDSGHSLYNRSMILWLQNIDIKMYSRFNEEKSVVAT